jgi:hypothetical protein
MTSHDFAAIDRQLAELGPVPDAAALQALIARHAGGDVTLQNVDGRLAAVGGRITVPPRLQATAVDVQAPVVAAPAPAPAPEPVAEVSAPTPSKPPGRMPWESDLPEASEVAQAEGAKVSVPPAPAPDLAALFDDDAVPPPRISVMPAEPPAPQTRKRHDTIEQMPSVSPRLASLEALDLGELGAPPAPRAPSEAEAKQSDVAADQVPVLEEDEFEILVDDEILEIDDET